MEGKKILLVEDEELLLKGLVEKFTSAGFIVHQAHDGKEGLEVALKEHPDIILSDIIMPFMDGLSMIKHLREDEWGKQVPIILLTNVNDAPQLAEATTYGVNDYLVKSDWSLDAIGDKVKEKLHL